MNAIARRLRRDDLPPLSWFHDSVCPALLWDYAIAHTLRARFYEAALLEPIDEARVWLTLFHEADEVARERFALLCRK